MHAVQGATVDTTHTIVTPCTSRNALYVGMSRGRERNTAHITTVTGPDDPARGREDETIHRDPVAALAAIVGTDHLTAGSALATAAESAADMASLRTPAELFADAALLAATHRTATWLDELAGDGTLSRRERARIAAEDGAASLTRILRRAEIGGYDPRPLLVAAITERPLDGARNTTNVIYTRISDRHRFEPAGQSWTDWTPHIDDPAWQTYLDQLAAATDERVLQLDVDATLEPSAWAIDAFGPAPADPDDRDSWITRVGTVAAYRELRDHHSDTDALGPPPQPGQPEAFAAYRAAWKALGRPSTAREEHELSDGQLRMRARAAEREAAWAPRYVGNELAGTRDAAERHRQTAALRRAEADSARGAERERLAVDAADASALAQTLEQRVSDLEGLEDARARWLAHTAATRAAGDGARVELARRHAADTEPDPQVTAQEWLAAHHQAQAADDQDREITADYELDSRIHAHTDVAVAMPAQDIRALVTTEAPQYGEDAVRVPTAEDTADALRRAHRALAEIDARTLYDQEHESLERARGISWADPAHLDAQGIDRHADEGFDLS
ncbi:MAG: hypothetical protein ABS81_16380 [Pseudonocardia sp. SCN 72-86]|nr:MAG: hypothetical protein ABS81_16380 [Pseudonocardia sp. SCN 72-86]